jgi:hypothetical protein
MRVHRAVGAELSADCGLWEGRSLVQCTGWLLQWHLRDDKGGALVNQACFEKKNSNTNSHRMGLNEAEVRWFEGAPGR